MKLTYSFLTLSALSANGAFASTRNVESKRQLKNLPESCIGVLVDVQYPPGSGQQTDDQWLACQDTNGLAYKVASANKAWIKENFSNGNKFKSGETELVFDSDAVLDLSTNEIKSKSPPGLMKKEVNNGNGNNGNGNGSNKRQLAVTTGEKSILVVRVVAANASPTATESRLGDSVFGTLGDPVTLKSQYSKCSHGGLTILPADDRDGMDGANAVLIRNGTVTVTVSSSTTDGDGIMVNDVTAKLQSMFGTSASNLANHVMYCLPPGTMSGIAYAYINSWSSVYSDLWCTYLSTQMHEIGYNINLAHSGENGATYADQSGMMGYSYSQDNGPEMCFNAAKSWQLGWYDGRKLTVGNGHAISYEGFLAGIIEDPSLTGEPPILIKINTVGSTDYYLTYNRKTSFNSGTEEGGNQVMVVSAGGEGSGYAESSLLAKLSAGATFSVSDIKITVVGISDGRANVKICIANGCETASPTASPTKAPTTSPTKAPTTASPTATPTKAPTTSPTASPTKVSTTSPTAAPTKVPTTASPTVTPTKAPTTSPTASPTKEPTTSPTVSPTKVPTTASPTATPTASPTKAPTTSPTVSPTKVPTTTSPTASPTKVPTTTSPTASPTKAPTTASPTATPTKAPMASSTPTPTKVPTTSPTVSPTKVPTTSPTASPTKVPTTASPTATPTKAPTATPTTTPTKEPTDTPTAAPTKAPVALQCVGLKNKVCKQTSGCTVMYGKCTFESIYSTKCAAFNSKPGKCKENGCVYNSSTKICNQ